MHINPDAACFQSSGVKQACNHIVNETAMLTKDVQDQACDLEIDVGDELDDGSRASVLVDGLAKDAGMADLLARAIPLRSFMDDYPGMLGHVQHRGLVNVFILGLEHSKRTKALEYPNICQLLTKDTVLALWLVSNDDAFRGSLICAVSDELARTLADTLPKGSANWFKTLPDAHRERIKAIHRAILKSRSAGGQAAGPPPLQTSSAPSTSINDSDKPSGPANPSRPSPRPSPSRPTGPPTSTSPINLQQSSSKPVEDPLPPKPVEDPLPPKPVEVPVPPKPVDVPPPHKRVEDPRPPPPSPKPSSDPLLPRVTSPIPPEGGKPTSQTVPGATTTSSSAPIDPSGTRPRSPRRRRPLSPRAKSPGSTDKMDIDVEPFSVVSDPQDVGASKQHWKPEYVENNGQQARDRVSATEYVPLKRTPHKITLTMGTSSASDSPTMLSPIQAPAPHPPAPVTTSAAPAPVTTSAPPAQSPPAGSSSTNSTAPTIVFGKPSSIVQSNIRRPSAGPPFVELPPSGSFGRPPASSRGSSSRASQKPASQASENAASRLARLQADPTPPAEQHPVGEADGDDEDDNIGPVLQVKGAIVKLDPEIEALEFCELTDVVKDLCDDNAIRANSRKLKLENVWGDPKYTSIHISEWGLDARIAAAGGPKQRHDNLKKWARLLLAAPVWFRQAWFGGVLRSDSKFDQEMKLFFAPIAWEFLKAGMEQWGQDIQWPPAPGVPRRSRSGPPSVVHRSIAKFRELFPDAAPTHPRRQPTDGTPAETEEHWAERIRQGVYRVVAPSAFKTTSGKSAPAAVVTAAHKYLTGQGEYRRPAWSLWGSSETGREVWKPVLDAKEQEWGDNNPKGTFDVNRLAVLSAIWKELFPRQPQHIVDMYTEMAGATAGPDPNLWKTLPDVLGNFCKIGAGLTGGYACVMTCVLGDDGLMHPSIREFGPDDSPNGSFFADNTVGMNAHNDWLNHMVVMFDKEPGLFAASSRMSGVGQLPEPEIDLPAQLQAPDEVAQRSFKLPPVRGKDDDPKKHARKFATWMSDCWKTFTPDGTQWKWVVAHINNILAVDLPDGVFFGNPTNADLKTFNTLYDWVMKSYDPKSDLRPDQRFRWKVQALLPDGLPALQDPAAPKKRGKVTKDAKPKEGKGKEKEKEKEPTKRKVKSKATVDEEESEEDTEAVRIEPPATRNAGSRTASAAPTAPPAPDSDDIKEFVPEGERIAQRIETTKGRQYVPVGTASTSTDPAASTSTSVAPTNPGPSTSANSPAILSTSTDTTTPGAVVPRTVKGLRVRVRQEQEETQLISLQPPVVAAPDPAKLAEFKKLVTSWVKTTHERRVNVTVLEVPAGLPHLTELTAILAQLRLAEPSGTTTLAQLEQVGEEGWAKDTIQGRLIWDLVTPGKEVPYGKTIMDSCQHDADEFKRTIRFIYAFTLAHVNALRYKISDSPLHFPFRLARFAVLLRGADVLMQQHFPNLTLPDNIQLLVDDTVVVMAVVVLNVYLETLVRPVIAQRASEGHSAVWNFLSEFVTETIDSLDSAIVNGRSDLLSSSSRFADICSPEVQVNLRSLAQTQPWWTFDFSCPHPPFLSLATKTRLIERAGLLSTLERVQRNDWAGYNALERFMVCITVVIGVEQVSASGAWKRKIGSDPTEYKVIEVLILDALKGLLSRIRGAPEEGDWDDPVDPLTWKVTHITEHQMWKDKSVEKDVPVVIDMNAINMEDISDHEEDATAGADKGPLSSPQQQGQHSPPRPNSRVSPSSPDVPLRNDRPAPVVPHATSSPATPRRTSQPPTSEADEDGDPTPRAKAVPPSDIDPHEYNSSVYGEDELEPREEDDHQGPPTKKRRLITASSDVEGGTSRKSATPSRKSSRARKPPPPPGPTLVSGEAGPSGSSKPKNKGKKVGKTGAKNKA